MHHCLHFDDVVFCLSGRLYFPSAWVFFLHVLCVINGRLVEHTTHILRTHIDLFEIGTISISSPITAARNIYICFYCFLLRSKNLLTFKLNIIYLFINSLKLFAIKSLIFALVILYSVHFHANTYERNKRYVFIVVIFTKI